MLLNQEVQDVLVVQDVVVVREVVVEEDPEVGGGDRGGYVDLVEVMMVVEEEDVAEVDQEELPEEVAMEEDVVEVEKEVVEARTMEVISNLLTKPEFVLHHFRIIIGTNLLNE